VRMIECENELMGEWFFRLKFYGRKEQGEWNVRMIECENG
jgi:hypothetical protein